MKKHLKGISRWEFSAVPAQTEAKGEWKEDLGERHEDLLDYLFGG